MRAYRHYLESHDPAAALNMLLRLAYGEEEVDEYEEDYEDNADVTESYDDDGYDDAADA